MEGILIFLEFILGSEQTEKFASRAILQQKIQFFLILETHLHFDEEGVFDLRKNLLLGHYVFFLILLENIFFFENLQCVKLVVLQVPHQ